MQTLRTTNRALLLAALMLLVLLVPTGAQAAPPYEAQERQFLKLINASRRSAGHDALAASPDVATIARNWSKRMAADGDLRHNPNVSSQLTMDWRRWGENVGWASNRADGALSSVVVRLHRGFMNSAGHRANIMGDFNQVGVGVAIDGDGTMWATMVFVDGPVAHEPARTKEPAGTRKPVGLSDIAGSTHRAAINTAWRQGLMTPCKGRRFCPRKVVTRAEVADVVARMRELRPREGDHFVDIGSGPSRINALADAGIVNGCDDRRFCPQARVTRAQTASMLVRALPGLEPTGGARFADLPGGYVHTGAINALAAAGVTRGCDSGRFCPTARVTREQLASFVVRALDV